MEGVPGLHGAPQDDAGLILPMQEMQVQSLGQEVLLEKGIATHSSILAWRVPWTEKPGGLQSLGLQKSWTWLSD